MIFLQIFIGLLVQFISFFYLHSVIEKENTGKEKQNWLIVIVSVGFNLIFTMIAKSYAVCLVDFLKWIFLYQIIYCAAVVDYRKKRIPNILILLGVICHIIYFFVKILGYKDNWNKVLVQDFMGFLMGAGVLLLVYLFAKNAIGMGDIKLFSVLGITCGFELTYTILFLAVLLAACYGLCLVLFRKKKKNYEMAFAPFIFLGYISSLVFSILSI